MLPLVISSKEMYKLKCKYPKNITKCKKLSKIDPTTKCTSFLTNVPHVDNPSTHAYLLLISIDSTSISRILNNVDILAKLYRLAPSQKGANNKKKQ